VWVGGVRSTTFIIITEKVHCSELARGEGERERDVVKERRKGVATDAFICGGRTGGGGRGTLLC
jgi:hypothetical protein